MTLIPSRAFWISTHRYLGLATLGFLTIAAVTGCLLCLRPQLDAALNPDLFKASSKATVIDPVVAVTAFQAARPAVRVLSFPLHRAKGANLPVLVTAMPGARPLGYDQLFLDGADGHLVGTRTIRPGWSRRELMEGVYTLHFTLLAGTFGRWFMGMVAIGWLVGALVGVYLTFPARRPYIRPWLKAWTVRFKSRLPRVMLDLHQASSLWLIVGVLALAGTSVCLNFFGEMFEPAMMAMSPAKPSPFDRPAKPAPQPKIGFAQALDAGLTHAKANGSSWRAASVSYDPGMNLYGVMFTHSGTVTYSGLGPVTDYVSAADGRFVYEDSPYADSFGRKMTRVLYPIHTGQIAGPIGMAFIFVVGLQTIELSVTGLYVWWKRRPPRVAFRKANRATVRRAA